jgi:hypothetical protein
MHGRAWILESSGNNQMSKLSLRVTIAGIGVLAVASILATILLKGRSVAEKAQMQERVVAIRPPAIPLPSETKSQGVERYSFIAYGDTRGRQDGVAIQYEHSRVVDSMLTTIKTLQNTDYPVRFVLQSGDAVTDGRISRQWNVSFIPLINRLTGEGAVTYFLTPGNHEATSTKEGLRNYLDAVSNLIPPEGSLRRLQGHTTYSFGFGNTFVIALDSNVADDEKQYQWIKSQLENLDRERYVNIFVFCHQAPFSSGPHGGSHVEPQTMALRNLYMPLFNANHVRVLFSGHEHLFEHWVEHYTDSIGAHRVDLVVSGGGGAPIYTYTEEPDLRDYLKANEDGKVNLEHLVKPGNQDSPTPHHYVVVRVDGDNLNMEVIGVDGGRGFDPYRSKSIELQDSVAPVK